MVQKTTVTPIISIHSPRVERDICYRRVESVHQDFNPLAPCGARPEACRGLPSRQRISIHSPRVERDLKVFKAALKKLYFNPLAPCGARLVNDDPCAALIRISIHSPRVERDRFGVRKMAIFSKFQSTRPVWSETSR